MLKANKYFFYLILTILGFFFFFAGVVPLATYMRIYKKGDIVDIKVNYKTGELTTE